MHTTLTIHIFDILQVEAALGKTEDAIHNFEKVSILKNVVKPNIARTYVYKSCRLSSNTSNSTGPHTLHNQYQGCR